MSRQLPAEGDYTAECIGQLKVIEAKTGTLGVAVPYKLTDSEVPFSDTHVVYIAKADGTLLTNGIDNLKKVFTWDGQDPFWLMEDGDQPRNFNGLQFRLAGCVHEDYETEGGKKGTSFKPAFLNPLDGGRQFQLADKKSVLAKFGSKFRANSGGAKAAPAKSAGPAKKSGPPGKPAAAPEPCTMEDAWGAFKKKNPSMSEDEMGEVWWKKIGELFPEVPENKQDSLTKEQYGKLRAALG